jgi:hypothetical protein
MPSYVYASENLIDGQGIVQAVGLSASQSTNPVLPYQNNVTQGDVLICAAAFQSDGGDVTVSDTQTNDWSELGTYTVTVGSVTLTVSLFWTLAGATGANTVTVSVSGVTTPTDVWAIAAEFAGVNAPSLPASGSQTGFGFSPGFNGFISEAPQITTPALTIPTGAMNVVVAATAAQTGTWTIDVQNNWYYLVLSTSGLCMAFAPNLYVAGMNSNQQPETPILDNEVAASTQWVALCAPFTNTAVPGIVPQYPYTNLPSQGGVQQHPHYPYGLGATP